MAFSQVQDCLERFYDNLIFPSHQINAFSFQIIGPLIFEKSISCHSEVYRGQFMTELIIPPGTTKDNCSPLWKRLSSQILCLEVKLTYPQYLGLPLQEGLQIVCVVQLDDIFLWGIRAKPCSCSFWCINTIFSAVNVNILQRTDSFFNPFLVDMKNVLWKNGIMRQFSMMVNEIA